MSDEDWDPVEELKDVEGWTPGQLAQHQANEEDGDNEDGSQAEEEDDEDAEDLEDAFYENQLDPITLLEDMGKQAIGSQEGGEYQPYQVLTRTARQARAQGQAPRPKSAQQTEPNSSEEEAEAQQKKKKRRKGQKFGATVDDIWEGDVAETAENFEKAKRSLRQRARYRRRKTGKTRRELPEEVSKKQGEANLAYALGKFKDAIPLLEEVIRAAPSLPDPYKTLGLCYEQTDNRRKALDFYMITAHMTPKDIALWKRLAALSSEMGFMRQAIYCLTKVIMRDKTDTDALFDRSLMYVEVGEARRARAGMEKLLELRPGDSEVPIILARIYHSLEQPEKAVETLEGFLRQHPLATEPTHINILAELYMEGKDYKRASQLIERASSHVCKDGLPIDLQVKLGLAYVHTARFEDALDQLQILFQDPIEVDLCLDAADSLLQNEKYAEALKLYERVGLEALKSNDLWSKVAECYRKTDNLPAAVNVYVNIANGDGIPTESRQEAAISLAEALSSRKMTQQTVSALKYLDKLGTESMDLLSRKGKVLLDMGDKDGYLDIFLPIVKETLHRAVTKKPKSQSQKSALDKMAESRRRIIERAKRAAEEGAIFKGFVTKDRRTRHRIEADQKLAELLAKQSTNEGDQATETKEQQEALLLGDLSKEDQDLKNVLRTARVLMEVNEPLQASEMLADCITHLTRRWQDRESKEKRDTLRLAAAEAAVTAGEPALAMHHIRHVCATWPQSAAVWNVLCQATIAAPTMIRQANKTVAALSVDFQDNLSMRLINGHSQALDAAHGNALREYMAAYHAEPEEVLCLLCVAVAHLNQAVNRRVPDRDAAVLASFAFLQAYSKKRENKQEAYYNLGRAAHQLGVLHLAAHWYYRALDAEVPQPWKSRASGQTASSIDLSKEIAYNLALLFRSSGAIELAREVMMKYITV